MTLVQIKTIKEANTVVGGLAQPSKMPGYSISLSASKCPMGSKLRKIKGSVCENCYACKGRYLFSNVTVAHARRLEALNHPQWIEAVVFMINKRAAKSPVFRWHDSGDLQSMNHLEAILQVVRETPTVKHWLPTKEYKLISSFLKRGGKFPKNVCVRVSMPMTAQKPNAYRGLPTSTVNSKEGFACPVKNGSETCDTYNCRACWDNDVANIDYSVH